MKSKPKCRICGCTEDKPCAGGGKFACSRVTKPGDPKPLCSICRQFMDDLQAYVEQTDASPAAVIRAYHECAAEFDAMVKRVKAEMSPRARA